MLRTIESAVNLGITALLAPGIVAHESAHYLACKLFGVEVYEATLLNPLADTAGLDHERIESLPADVGIAFAPLVVNTPLALASFAVAPLVPSFVSLVCWWAGATFAFAAMPSHVDTETFMRTADELTGLSRWVGYAVAAPLRAATAMSWLVGVYGMLWVWVCLRVAPVL